MCRRNKAHLFIVWGRVQYREWERKGSETKERKKGKSQRKIDLIDQKETGFARPSVPPFPDLPTLWEKGTLFESAENGTGNQANKKSDAEADWNQLKLKWLITFWSFSPVLLHGTDGEKTLASSCSCERGSFVTSGSVPFAKGDLHGLITDDLTSACWMFMVWWYIRSE